MKPTKDELLTAFQNVIDAELNVHKKLSDDKDDLLDSYVHQQIILLNKEFPNLLETLYRGYELLKAEE